MTPPKASAPYRAEPGPRITSMRDTALTGHQRQALLRSPRISEVIGSPLIKTNVCGLKVSVPIPRKMNLAVMKGEALETCKPGTMASASSSVRAPIASMSAAVITVAVEGVCQIGT